MMRHWTFQNATVGASSKPPSDSRMLPVKRASDDTVQSTSDSSYSTSMRPPTAASTYTIPAMATSTVSVGHLIPPRKIGRVLSTPPSYADNNRNTLASHNSSGSATSAVLQTLQLQHQSRFSSARRSSSNNNSTMNRRGSATKRSNFLSHARSFDEKQQPLPPSVPAALTNIIPLSSSPLPASSPLSSAASTPKTPFSATSSTTSSTASVSSNEEENNDDSLYLTSHDRTSTIDETRKRQPKRLHRSLSSDHYNSYQNEHDSTINIHSDAVHWMDTIISTNQASSPPQDMKLTSVRKRPSPRTECDHHNTTYNDPPTSFVQRSSPPSSSSIFLQQQQQQHHHQSSSVQPYTLVSTPNSMHIPSSSSSTTVSSFRNSMNHKTDRSGSFRRRKGTKSSTMRKSLLRNKSYLFLRYMYLQRYFSTKRRSVFVLYTIGILLLLLFILSFSLSFLSSHRTTIQKLFLTSSVRDIITKANVDTEAIRNRNGNMMVPIIWNVIPKQKQQQEQVAGTTASSSNDSSKPSVATQKNEQQLRQNQQYDPSTPQGAASTISSSSIDDKKNSNIVIHTLRGRFKKHNLITKPTPSSDSKQPKNLDRWFGFSHLLLPPKKKQQNEQLGTATDVNATLVGESTGLRGGKYDSVVKSPILVDGKVYNFQQFTTFAPQCGLTLNGNTMSVKDIDFTIASQLSYNRLWMMEYHCVRWSQAMSLAIYIGNNQSAPITSESIRQEMIQMGCSEQQDITVQVLSGYSDEEYPVNVLRNMALSKVRTTHVVYIDVDFWVSTDLYTILNQHREALLSNSKLALVVPAFQLSRQCKEWRDCREMNIPKMPHIKDELVDLMMKHQANAFDPSNRGGHGSTRYKDWLLQSEDELVPIVCVKSNRYEPYLVFRLCQDLPPFQESFTGYGKNKMTWMMQIRRTGYQLMQLGGAFAVHYPHLDSTARMHWNGGVDGSQLPKPHDMNVDLSKFKRGQVDETFVAFRHWLTTSIPDNSVMPMCEDAQDDDQRLWIAPDKVIKVKSI